MENIELKKVLVNEIKELQKIGRQTFAEAFSIGNSEAKMSDYLNEGFSTEKLKIELSEPNSDLYFAVLNGDIIGYLKINFGNAQTEFRNKNALEIERIYVLKEFYGKNVGQQLLEKATEISNQKGIDFVWLGVWKKNSRAIRFYRRNGFVEFNKPIFIFDDNEKTDIKMKLQLNSEVSPVNTVGQFGDF